MIQNPLRTPLKLYAPTLACAALSLLPLLPSWASALSLFASLRLSSSPRALALVGLVCPPRCPLSWLVFLAPLLRGFGLVCWRGLVFVWLGLSVFLCAGGFGLFPFSRLAFVGFARRQSGLGHSYILLSPAPLKPSLIIVLVCLCADWTVSPVLLNSTGQLRLIFGFVR